MKILKAYKTELDLNNVQTTNCLRHAGAARYAYNWGLNEKKIAFDAKQKIPNAIELHRRLNALKPTDLMRSRKSSKKKKDKYEVTQNKYMVRRETMSKSPDLMGQKFGRWTVIGTAANTKNFHRCWLCRCECGTEKVVLANNLKRSESISCGCFKVDTRAKMKGENHPHWKGGRYYSKNGYVWLTNAEYPGSVVPNKTAEHVAVMARHIGRPLKKGEQIHHKNGIRDDNRIENLELWVKNQPHGGRIEDVVSWAKEILARYEPESLKQCG